jgi:TorA maturation chaperone TorD
MGDKTSDPSVLLCLSRAFSYPETWPDMGALEKIVFFADGNHEKNLVKTRLVDLQNEYVRLFINSLPEVPCAPYGSFYLEGVLMGSSAIGLKQLYQTYGFDSDEPADHIAVELEFLAFLCHMMGQKLDADEALHRDYGFVMEHLRAWTPVFFKRIQKHDETGFYLKLSKYTDKMMNG